ncbi:hypothetical protein ACQQ6W_09545 [Lysinibacillus fusiformis]
MTYCVAWKKDGEVFLIADSITSTISKEEEGNYEATSSFGETQGLYTNYWTKETSQKIIKINKNLAVAYSCDNEKKALEAISYLHLIDQITLLEILQMLCSTYENGFELIIVYMSDNGNKIYHWHNAQYVEINDFIEIGSGKYIPNLSKSFRSIIANYRETKSINSSNYLTDILSTIQCISIRNNFIKYGVGGMFFGLFLHKEIEWSRDILYHITQNIESKNIVSVICRNDTIFYASSYNDKIRYFFDDYIQEKIKENPYLLEAMIKTINTVVPDYIVYFDKETNSKIMLIIDRNSCSLWVNFWIKRLSNEVKFAIITNPVVLESLGDTSASGAFLPNNLVLYSPKKEFISRERFVKLKKIEEVVPDLNEIYDYDFNYLNIEQYIKLLKNEGLIPHLDENFNIDSAIDSILAQHIEKYSNIVIIDAHYLDQLINEKLQFYKQVNEDITLSLEPIVSQFSSQIASDNFEEYIILVLINKDISDYLNNVLFNEWNVTHSNLYIIEDNNNKYLATNIFSTIKKYYIDESYFHIDKIILFCEDEVVSGILQFVPYSNFEMNNIDILLIREINPLTKMDFRFRYAVSDLVLGAMFKLTVSEIGYAESLIEEFNR